MLDGLCNDNPSIDSLTGATARLGKRSEVLPQGEFPLGRLSSKDTPSKRHVLRV
jgi:hypothetical protein